MTVKEDLVEVLHGSKLSALGLMESMAKYYVGRAKLVSKKLKFPLSDDHTACIAELDKKQYFLLLNMVNDIKVSRGYTTNCDARRASMCARR